MNVPILHMDLNIAKENITTAMMLHQGEIAKQIQIEVDKQCSVEAIESLIEFKVSGIIKQTIAETIDDYYRYGKGKNEIKDAVLKALNN